MSKNFEDLARMCWTFEYYDEAFGGDDPPFPDHIPESKDLCRWLEQMARTGWKVLEEYRAMAKELGIEVGYPDLMEGAPRCSDEDLESI